MQCFLIGSIFSKGDTSNERHVSHLGSQTLVESRDNSAASRRHRIGPRRNDACRGPGHYDALPGRRLCQTDVYLGRALNYARNPRSMNTSRVTEVRALDDELGGFSVVVYAAAGDPMSSQAERSTFITLLGPRCVARSAVVVALDQFS